MLNDVKTVIVRPSGKVNYHSCKLNLKLGLVEVQAKECHKLENVGLLFIVKLQRLQLQIVYRW